MTVDSAGGRARFEAIYAAHYGAIWAYARRRLSDANDADDVSAQTWMAVWRRIDDVPLGSELPWCYAVARRCLANHRRGDDRRARLRQAVANERSIDAVREPDLRAASVQRALERLRPDDREILRLHAWERLSTPEIAVVLDVTPNTVSVRLHRAKRRLAAALKDHLDSGHSSGTAPEEPRPSWMAT